MVVCVSYEELFVARETRDCRSKQMSLGYPRNLYTYKYPNIMALCVSQIGLEHQLNSPISCCHHDTVGGIHGDGSEKMGTQIAAIMVN